MTTDTFTIGGVQLRFTAIQDRGLGGLSIGLLDNSGGLTPGLISGNSALMALNFCVGTRAFAFGSAAVSDDNVVEWGGAGLGWTAGTPVELSIGSSCSLPPRDVPPPRVTSTTTRRPRPTVTSPRNTVPRVNPTRTTTTTTTAVGGDGFVAPQRVAACDLPTDTQVVGLLPFTDVNAGSLAAADIARIYGLDITVGVTPTMFEPDSAVTREQMAMFLARLYRTLTTK